ncbi:MAG: pimeloyl-ACP methyl ester esterase BioH [Colwellia sp.]
MAETLVFSSKGQGVPLVFIHGWGLNSGVWQPLIEKMSACSTNNFELISLDLPGFGFNSDCIITPYSLANICHLINKAINKPAIYLGWSLGGLIATEMALTFPDKVLGLITVASSPCFIECDQKKNQKLGWPGIKPSVLKNFHQQLKEDSQKTIDGFLKIQAMGSPHIRQDIKQIRNLVKRYPVPSKKTLDQSLNLLETSDYTEQLRLIQQPFLRLYGNSDSLIPIIVANLVSQRIKNSDQHIFDKASHAPFISHPDDFYQVLVSWLNKKFST